MNKMNWLQLFRKNKSKLNSSLHALTDGVVPVGNQKGVLLASYGLDLEASGEASRIHAASTDMGQLQSHRGYNGIHCMGPCNQPRWMSCYTGYTKAVPGRYCKQ